MNQPLQTGALKIVRRHFNSPVLSRESNRAHMRKWVKSIRQLGPRWVLHSMQSPSRTEKVEFPSLQNQ